MRAALFGLLLCCALPAWPAPPPERIIRLAETPGEPPLDPAAAAWERAPAATLRLYPQATIAGGPGGEPLTLEARVLRGGTRLALRLAWADAGENTYDAHATDRFADAVAVQFAPPGKTLPYVGMGEPGRAVSLWLWRAGRPPESLTAHGFGSLERGAAPIEAHARRSAGGWEVVLRGRVAAHAPVALAFAAWDGAEDGRAGRKRLSAWQALAAPTGALPASLREEARAGGDAARGERLYAKLGCAACHAPQAGLAPDLASAGDIHWPGYLRRSIREPSAFLVPGYAALMPAFPLQAEDIENLTAYLMKRPP